MQKVGMQDTPGGGPTLNRLQGGDALCISDYAELQDASIPKRGSHCRLLQGQCHAHGRVVESDAARLTPRNLAVLAVDCHNPARSNDVTVNLCCPTYCMHISRLCNLLLPGLSNSGLASPIVHQDPACSNPNSQRHS